MKHVSLVLREDDAPLWAIVTLLWVASLYLMIALFSATGFLSPALNLYLVQPVLWGSLALVGWLGYRLLPNRLAVQVPLIAFAVLAGVIQFVLFFLTGLIFGFGQSPYGHSFFVVLGNCLYITVMSVGVEMGRAYLALVAGKKKPLLALFLVTLLFTLVSIPPAQYGLLSAPGSAFLFAGKTLLPLLARNLLATFLVMLGGPAASIAYMGSLALLEWVFPVLPDLPWIVTACLGTLYPVLALAVFNQWLPVPSTRGIREVEKLSPAHDVISRGKWISWSLLIVFAVGGFGFNIGLFGIQPFVVSGESMAPTLSAGDIVITTTTQADDVGRGDVIRFKQQDIEIVHRIVAVQLDPVGNRVFITRGDNNNTDDPPVLGRNVYGKALFVVPKLGWVALCLRSFFTWASSP